MLEALRRAAVRLFGSADTALDVPVLDGPFKPNNLLEDAPVLFERTGLEDMAVEADGRLLVACATDVLRLDGGGVPTRLARFDAPVQALAVRPGGGFVAAVGGAIIFEGGGEHGRRLDTYEGRSFAGVNALASAPDGRLFISEGSLNLPYTQWSRDLLEHGRSGRVLEYLPEDGFLRVKASGLRYSFGICAQGKRILVSETWAHRVVELGESAPAVRVDGLPGYPARLSQAPGGGYWMSLFAGRTQLLEFILREDDFREEMMRTVQPEYWYAPSFLAGRDYLEPQQTAGVMQMGIMKPWAPPRSYGLVVRLNEAMEPQYTLHSRSGGRHHGIVAVAEHGGQLYALSKGAGRILRLATDALQSVSAAGVNAE